jgi:hypothetical protein
MPSRLQKSLWDFKWDEPPLQPLLAPMRKVKKAAEGAQVKAIRGVNKNAAVKSRFNDIKSAPNCTRLKKVYLSYLFA